MPESVSMIKLNVSRSVAKILVEAFFSLFFIIYSGFLIFLFFQDVNDRLFDFTLGLNPVYPVLFKSLPQVSSHLAADQGINPFFIKPLRQGRPRPSLLNGRIFKAFYEVSFRIEYQHKRCASGTLAYRGLDGAPVCRYCKFLPRSLCFCCGKKQRRQYEYQSRKSRFNRLCNHFFSPVWVVGIYS